MTKILTLAIPVYNMERYLSRCIDSIICVNNRPNLDVIIVNDGSTDGSLAIAKQYEHEYNDCIRVIDKPNGNYGSAVNKALESALGKYFRMVDSDDWVDSSALELLIQKLSDESADLVVTDYSVVKENKKEIHHLSFLQSGKEYNISDINIDAYDKMDNFVMHGMTFRLDVLKKCNLKLSEGISYTDTEYCFYPLFITETVRYFDICLYQYYVGREGQTVSISSYLKNKGNLFHILKRMIEHSTHTNVPDSIRQNCNHYVYRIGKVIYSTLLLNASKNVEKNIFLKEVDQTIYSYDVNLYRRFSQLNNNKIPYVKIWRFSGLFNSSFLFSFYNSLYNVFKQIKNS